MFLGYVGLDNNQFFDNNNRYFSGDLGRLHNDDFLEITGRKKDLIIKGGFNLSPKKIEDFILNLKIFDEVVILGIEEQYMGEKIVCFFCTNKKYFKDELKTINKQIVTRLGRECNIDEFVKLDSMPKTTSGKIDKPKIRENFNSITNGNL